jgi:hypothetical protein
MSMANNDRGNQQRKSGKFSFLLEEWVFQLVLAAAVVGVVIERGASIGGGMIV